MNSRITILNLFLVLANIAIMLSTVGHAQLGSPKANVTLQASTPGVSQSGHAHVSGTMRAGQFVGSGSGLSGISASQLLTGTLDDARLSSNVARRNVTNTFLSDQWFNAFVGIGQPFAGVNLDIRGNDPVIRLRNNADDIAGRQQATWESVQFGMQTMTASAVGVVPGNSSRAFIGFGADGRVGSLTNFFGAPAYRNLLDNGEGRGVVAHGLQVDGADLNPGNLDRGLRFGASNSGEGIASTRGAGPNQWGLDFYSGNQRRMSLTNTGNVGVGTATPTASLDVNGAARVRSNLTVDGSVAAANMPGVAYEQIVSPNYTVPDDTTANLCTVTVNAPTAGYIILQGTAHISSSNNGQGINFVMGEASAGPEDYYIGSYNAFGGYFQHVTHWVVPITSAGSITFKTWVSKVGTGSTVVRARTLIATFVPRLVG